MYVRLFVSYLRSFTFQAEGLFAPRPCCFRRECNCRDRRSNKTFVFVNICLQMFAALESAPIWRAAKTVFWNGDLARHRLSSRVNCRAAVDRLSEHGKEDPG
jgi:hypothetical protein